MLLYRLCRDKSKEPMKLTDTFVISKKLSAKTKITTMKRKASAFHTNILILNTIGQYAIIKD